jgi:hypothetical protein
MPSFKNYFGCTVFRKADGLTAHSDAPRHGLPQGRPQQLKDESIRFSVCSGPEDASTMPYGPINILLEGN